MKKLIYILFFITSGVYAQVNVWTYDLTANGGNENGTIEPSELQTAIDNETNLIISPATTITWTADDKIEIDQNMAQTIDFNGSAFARTTYVGYYLWIDKRSYSNSLTTIKNLDANGSGLGGSLIYAVSRVHMTDVHIHNARETVLNKGTFGLYLRAYDEVGAQGDWVFDNVDIDWITHAGVTATDGESEGLYVYWPVTVTGSGMQLIYKNSTMHDFWGYESNGMILNSANHDISFSTNNYLWFENMLMYNVQRRLVKNYIGNTTWVNSDFYQADYDNPNLLIGPTFTPISIFDIGAASGADGSKNNLICGCNFYGGYTQNLNGGNKLFGILATTGETSVEIRRSTFNGDNPNVAGTDYHGISTWTMWAGSGNTQIAKLDDIKICDCDFTAASTSSRGNMIFSGFTVMVSGKALQIDTNNTYTIGQTAAFANYDYAYDIIDLSGDCAVCPTIGGIVADTEITGIKLSTVTSNLIHFNENTVNPTATLEPITNETGETYTYTKTGNGYDAANFSISGDQITLNLTPDFEIPGDLGGSPNNIYAVEVLITSTSNETYTGYVLFQIDDVVEGAEVYVTSIAWDNDTQTILVGETVDRSHTFNGGTTTPDNTNISFYYSLDDNDGTLPQFINNNGLGLYKGTTSYYIVADDVTNGTIQDIMTVTINPDAWKKTKLAVGKVKTSSGKGKFYIGK